MLERIEKYLRRVEKEYIERDRKCDDNYGCCFRMDEYGYGINVEFGEGNCYEGEERRFSVEYRSKSYVYMSDGIVEWFGTDEEMIEYLKSKVFNYGE